MISQKIIVFAVLSLIISLGVSAALFPFSAVNDEIRIGATKPRPMEEFPDVDLGPDYGEVPVIELMGYYLENPPVKQSETSVTKQQHFGGC
ncbi:MAG: hypothetical protein C0631_16395 [Sedimenticola sp.]|jgi:hypothetical protein|nr:MAG: hypothetical protein C0631_16395 [Sedimenticola sp.]